VCSKQIEQKILLSEHNWHFDPKKGHPFFDPPPPPPPPPPHPLLRCA